ncbi:MAG: hypothetical protein OEX97_08885 [Acidimicrobiia bacterium]|nr:hypothetical protein [Acidimicrobiia bacterium]
MGQQPNIELEIDDAPRATHEPGAPTGWKPTRPGEISSPADMPVGGVFGNPSPDTGWVIKLIKQATFDRESGLVEDVVATIASTRASVFGRGPVPDDVEAALIVLGLRADGLSPAAQEDLNRRRAGWIGRAAHEPVRGRSALEEIGREFLHQTVDEIRAGITDHLA